ncbi:ABC transporter substrate-binding protein [[Clostridium] dakarense]|uniref:ABC transporter substrate-binding protein n=1 Tax=Faecalimicrobium dakarense TaxID=1301100 RepID=UPI0004B32ECF|nr:ABC transporter substrate-binding protein [[Clostridium] dakarense]
MKRRISILLSVVMSSILLMGCSQTSKDMTNSEGKLDNKEIKISAPDGLPSIALAKLINEDIKIKEGYDTKYTIEKTPESLSTSVMKEDVDIAIVPSNMAAIAYNKTSNYQIAGTVGMGSFYLVSIEDIKELKDLEECEVGNTGKGLTPDITAQAILKDRGVDLEKINFSYVNSVNELVPILATNKLSTAFIPEPALTGLLNTNKKIKIIKSLNDEWKEINNSKEGYPQSTIIVKTDFAKENKEFVDSFINQISDSVKWANTNSDKVGEYAKEIGISIESTIIGKAMERANLKFVPIKDMTDDYNDYYKKLFDFDSKSVGGKLPDEGIYFISK